jgi:outer membrane protein
MPVSAKRSRFRLPVALAASVLAFGVAAPLAAQAQKIAIIDTERVLTASAVGKQALESLTALRQQKQQQGDALEKELADLQNRLQEGRLSLSDDKLAELQRQAEDKALAMRRFQDDANRELAKKRDDVLAEVDQKVMPVITRYGQQNGYDLIFRKFESGLIYANDASDITDEVIAALDAGGA